MSRSVAFSEHEKAAQPSLVARNRTASGAGDNDGRGHQATRRSTGTNSALPRITVSQDSCTAASAEAADTVGDAPPQSQHSQGSAGRSSVASLMSCYGGAEDEGDSVQIAWIRQTLQEMTPEEQAVLASVFERQLEDSRSGMKWKWSIETCLRQAKFEDPYEPKVIQDEDDTAMSSSLECCRRCDEVRACFLQIYKFSKAWLCSTCMLSRYVAKATGEWMPGHEIFSEMSIVMLEEINKQRQLSISPEQWQDQCRHKAMCSAKVALFYSEAMHVVAVSLAEIRGLALENLALLRGCDHFKALVCLQPDTILSETFRIVTDALPAVDNCDATSIFYFDNQDPVDVEQSSLCVLLFSIGSNDVIAKVEYPLSSLPLNETATFIQLVQPMASERERYNEIVASALAEGKSRGRRRSLHPMNPEPAPLTTPEPERESENRLTAAESPQKERSRSLLPGLGKVFKKKAWANRTQAVADVDNVPAIPDITNLWSSTEDDLDDVVVSDGPRLPAVQATSIKRTFRSVRSFIEMCEDETLRATNEAFTNIQEQDQKQGMTLLQMSVKSYEPEPELLLQKSRGPAVRGAKKATEPRLVFRKALYDDLKEHEKPLYVLRSMMVAEGEYSDTQEYTSFGAEITGCPGRPRHSLTLWCRIRMARWDAPPVRC
eukprot:scpid21531/ scgid6046/ 